MNSVCERIQQVIHRAVSGMSVEQLEWRPVGKWSAGDVIEHLTLTYSGTRTGLERCVAAGRTLARTPTLKDRIVIFVVVRLGYLPTGRQAPEMTKPKGITGSKALEQFDQELAAMEAAIQECEQRFGSGCNLITHPILGPLSARQWRKFHLVHAQHHARQIEKLRDNLQGKP